MFSLDSTGFFAFLTPWSSSFFLWPVQFYHSTQVVHCRFCGSRFLTDGASRELVPQTASAKPKNRSEKAGIGWGHSTSVLGFEDCWGSTSSHLEIGSRSWLCRRLTSRIAFDCVQETSWCLEFECWGRAKVPWLQAVPLLWITMHPFWLKVVCGSLGYRLPPCVSVQRRVLEYLLKWMPGPNLIPGHTQWSRHQPASLQMSAWYLLQ